MEKLLVKRVRAKAKTQYYKLKEKECFICGSTKNLELHHIFPLSEIISKYLKENNIKEGEEDINALVNLPEIYDPKNLVTLCKTHHYYLHVLFGFNYPEKMVNKVHNYINKQRSRQYGVHKRAD